MPDSSTNTIIGLGVALGLVTIWAIANQVKINRLQPPVTPEFVTLLVNFLKTWFGLIPYVYLLAGPIIDAINSQFMYTKASIVGIITVLIVSLFGSDKFAAISKNITGMFPPIYSPSTVPGVPADWNYWMIGVYLILITIAFIPMIIGKLQGWAWGSSLALGLSIILTLLAGNDWLGSATSAPTPPRPTAVGWFSGLGRNDICVTPGLESINTRVMPGGILLTTSILSSHMFESIDTGNKGNAIGSGVLALLSFAIEYSIIISHGCLSDYKYGWVSPFLSLLVGTGAGATAYYTMKQFGQEAFTQPSQEQGVFHPPPAPETAKKTSDSSKKIVVGPQAETSEPVDESQDAFVCEAYKDGELITSTIVD